MYFPLIHGGDDDALASDTSDSGQLLFACVARVIKDGLLESHPARVTLDWERLKVDGGVNVRVEDIDEVTLASGSRACRVLASKGGDSAVSMTLLAFEKGDNDAEVVSDMLCALEFVRRAKWSGGDFAPFVSLGGIVDGQDSCCCAVLLYAAVSSPGSKRGGVRSLEAMYLEVDEVMDPAMEEWRFGQFVLKSV